MTDNYQDPAVGARAHFNGGFLGTQLTDVSQKIFSTAEGGTFSTRNVGEILGIGEYPKNTEAFPLAILNTFDSLAVDAGVKCIIYSGQNFSGDVLLEKTGPFVIYNYFMRHFQGGSFDPSIAPLWVDSEEVPQQPGVTYGELFPAEVRTWDAAIGGNMHNWSSGSMKLVAVATDGNYQDPGATASDAEDGDITHKIVKTITKTTTFQGSTFEAPVDNIPLDSEGAYTINYSVTDSAGVSATTSRQVNVASGSVTTSTPALPEDFVTAQQACNAAANLDGYLYDDDHYVIRYIDFRATNVGGFTTIHEFYVYGSESSSISNFGNSSQTFNTQTLYFIPSGATALFKTDQCGGYLKFASILNIPQLGGQVAAVQLHSLLKDTIELHGLDQMPNAYATYFASNSYRNYIHPQSCAAEDAMRIDVWHKNAVITKKGSLVTNRGATANHLSIMNSLSSSGFTSTHNNLAAGEEISIYPIKKA